MGTFADGKYASRAGFVTGSKETYGKPDGPMKWIDEFGCEVGTFTQARKDLIKKKDPGQTSLMYHVPFDKRGYYKPDQCADYDPEEYDYLIDDRGYAMCTLNKKDGTPCSRRAMHMSWKCSAHGGKLHPLDKIVNDDRDMMPTADGSEGLTGVDRDPTLLDRMTRFQKLCQGIISVEDLDDEELARGQCRNRDGGFSARPPKMIPKAVHDRMVEQLFERANQAFKVALVPAVETLGKIAIGDAYEPADRIKAASLIVDRVMGKNAEVIVHKQDSPWELALSTITGGSRAESRKARGLDPETGEPIDAEIVSIEGETTEERRQRLLAELEALDAEDEAEFDDDDWNADAMARGAAERNDDVEDVESIPGTAVVAVDDGWSNKPGEEPAYNRAPEKSPQEKAEEATDLRERLKSGRRQRYAARARGLDTVTETPYEMSSSPAGEGFFIKFKLPKAPAKKRGNDDFRHTI